MPYVLPALPVDLTAVLLPVLREQKLPWVPEFLRVPVLCVPEFLHVPVLRGQKFLRGQVP